MHKTKVLVTGSNGFIASSFIASYAQDKDLELYGISVGKNRVSALIPLRYYDVDITNWNRVNSLVNNIRPDIIIHCAALSQVDYCEENPEKCKQVNVLATENLARISETIGAHFVFLSSDFVFDGQKNFVSEADIPSPISEYGRSKLEAEIFIQNNLSNWSIVRPVLVYGFSASARRGNIFTWIAESAKTNNSVNVVADQIRTPTYVGDVVKLIYHIASSNAQGVYNIGGSDVISVFGFAKVISASNPSILTPVKSDNLGGANLRPQNSCFKSTKARNEFNLDPLGVKEGVKLAFDELSAQF